VKLAAAEAVFRTQAGAPLTLGGWPDVAARENRFAVEIPSALSLLAFHDPHAVVQGLDRVPESEWPNVPAVHLSFQVMVALGTYLALVALWAAWLSWRRADLAHNRWLMRAIVLATPMGFIAVEAGWMVTELGRQPWVIYGVLKTRDAVTPMPGLVVPFVTFTLLYCFLGVIVVWLLYRHIIRSPAVPEWRGFYMSGADRDARRLARRSHFRRAQRLRGAGGRRFRRRRVGPPRVRPSQRTAARADRRGHRPGVGGEPCMAHPGDRAALPPASRRRSPGSARCCTSPCRSC